MPQQENIQMRRRLHWIASGLFLIVLLADLVMWGAVPALPDVGVAIERSASREALLASTYISIGSRINELMPSLASTGESMVTSAISPAFQRISEDPGVAMDLILNASYNRAHAWLKFSYWAAPVLLVLSLLLWVRKPKQVSLIRGR
jgi:hypothetical protein